jgi:hypothetical protein
MEVPLVAQMLLGPELCRAVDSSGEVSHFGSVPLREVAERAIAEARSEALDAPALIASVESERLRRLLLHEFEEAERGRAPSLKEQLESLQQKLARHEKLARQNEIVRKREREPKVPKPPA